MIKHKKLLITTLVMLIAYFPVLVWMWDRWWARDSYYSHGILIPFVSGYLIWQMREELKHIEIKQSPIGLLIIISGLLLYFISALFRVNFTAGFSMFIVIIGMVLYFYGINIFKKISFPILFLFFMFPLPEVVIANISFRMKLFAAHIATIWLNKIGIPAFQKGSIILMRSAQIVVDDVCSGLRSLISLTALGSIFAFWMKSSIPRRILLFLTTIPIAIITNICRIIFLASVTDIWGPKAAGGIIHEISGFIVFALAFTLLYGATKLIE